MNASTYEALSLISQRSSTRHRGGVDGSPRLAPRTGHGRGCMPSRRRGRRVAPSRGLVGARTQIHAIPQTGTPNWLRSGPHGLRATRQVAIVEPNGAPLCDWFEIR